MGDLGEVADRRDAGVARGHLEPRQRGRRDPEHAGRARGDATLEQARPRLGAEDRDGTGVGDGRGDRAEADPAPDVQQAEQLEHVRPEAVPAVVGLGAGQDQQVAVAVAHVVRVTSGQASDERRPSRISSVGRRER